MRHSTYDVIYWRTHRIARLIEENQNWIFIVVPDDFVYSRALLQNLSIWPFIAYVFNFTRSSSGVIGEVTIAISEPD